MIGMIPKRAARRRGSISLLLALLFPILAGLLALLAVSARAQAEDAAVGRAMSAQIRAGLARYEQPLLETYGLFAFRADRVDSRIYDTCLVDMDSNRLDLIPQQPLFAADELESQIITFMAPRLPSVVLERLLRPFNQLAVNEDWPGLTRSTGWLSSLSAASGDDWRDGLFSGLIDQVDDENAGWLAQVYREAAVSLAGVPSTDGTSTLQGLAFDFFDPATVSDAARMIESLMSFESPALYEKLCLSEYVLGCFGRSVDQVWRQDDCQPLCLMNGQPLSRLPTERRAEAEQILTGIEHPKLAILMTKTAISSVRSLIHLVHLLLDQEAMATIRGTSAALSAAIAAASAGSVVVDPEMMTWLVVAGRSLQKGWTDTRRLCRGYGVAIWPDDAIRTPALYYEDYLRLFLLIQPRHRLVEQTGRRIAACLPGPFYCALRVETDWRGQRLALEGRYP